MTPPTGSLARTALATQSDERLVRLLRDGHERAFDELVRRYRGPLVAFSTVIVGPDRAEDAVQTAFEKAHRALLRDDRPINLRPWLFTIVRNGSLNLIRAEPITDELEPWLTSTSTADDPELAAQRNEQMERVVTAICALPAAQREALVRREFEGVGHGEIAAQLGTTATAVRGLIFRARTQLRNAIGAMVPVPLLRAMLVQGSGAGIAGGGASALIGGVGAKGGAAAAAAVIALAAGIAVERRHGDDGGGGDVAVAQAAERSHRGGSGHGGGADGTDLDAAAPRSGRDDESPGRRPEGRAGDAGSGGRPEGAGGGSGSGGGDADSQGPGTSGGGHSGGDDSGSGHSVGETPESPEQEDPHGDHSGPSGHESSDDAEQPDPAEPADEPEDDSGPGDDAEDPGHEGPGSAQSATGDH